MAKIQEVESVVIYSTFHNHSVGSISKSNRVFVGCIHLDLAVSWGSSDRGHGQEQSWPQIA